jgi:hypothetical protein
MTISLVASPTIINAGGIFGLTWNGAPGQPGDWCGLFDADAPDTHPHLWVMAEAPSYTWTLPAVFPPQRNYQFRMFSRYSFNKLGSSNHVWIQDPYAAQPDPQPTPQPQPSGSLLYDLTNAIWYPGPIINGQNYSPGAQSSYQRIIGPWPSPGEIDYITTPCPGPLPLGGKIIFRCRLSNGPLLGTVDPIAIANLNLHIRRRGDNWTGQGKYAWYRTWAIEGIVLNNIPSGEFELITPLTPEHWTGVFTAPNQDFAALLADPEDIGITCGDSQSKGHGVQNSTGATLEILKYEVHRS